MDVRVGYFFFYKESLSPEELMLLNCGVGEDSWESLGLQGDPASPSYSKSVLNIHWKDWWCWSWNSSTLATYCEELTHWKRPWCWERLKAGGEGDVWMASPTRWTWAWASSKCWLWTGKPGMLQSMGLQRVRDDRATELNINLYSLNEFAISSVFSSSWFATIGSEWKCDGKIDDITISSLSKE